MPGAVMRPAGPASSVGAAGCPLADVTDPSADVVSTYPEEGELLVSGYLLRR
jgi:hypothetical protein